MQLSYVTKSKLIIWNWPFIIYIMAHLTMLGYSIVSNSSAHDLHKFAISMALLQAFFWLEFAVSVILQLKRVLNIEVFGVKDRSANQS